MVFEEETKAKEGSTEVLRIVVMEGWISKRSKRKDGEYNIEV